jgi:lipopolysaccharide transport system permease protein
LPENSGKRPRAAACPELIAMSEAKIYAQKEDLSQWSLVLTPKTRWFDLGLAELWQYRDLILMFVRRDLVATYKQTILGPLWFLVQPLLTTIMFTLIFGRVAGLSTDGLPRPLFYMCGIVAWSYFADCLTKTSNTFVINSQIFGKVYFPRLAVPFATVITNLLTFCIQFSFFLAFFFFYYFKGAPLHPSWRVLITPLLLVQMAALGLGVGCFVSAVTTRYRDLALLVNFGVQLWLYGSCVAYPLSQVPRDWRWLFILNPMVPIIEAFRFAFLGSGIIEKWHLAVGGSVSALIFCTGIILFRHTERTFSDTI